MHRAGGESWRIGIGGDQAVHALLFIRDALRLTPSGADVPPRLRGDLAQAEGALGSDERTEISAAWLEWWRRFIHVQGAAERGELTGVADPSEGRARQRAAVFAVFDPPEFACLGDSLALQAAARRVGNEALTWGAERGAAPQERSAWRARKAVAEAVIAEYQVSPARVSAGVIVLAVRGRWSHIPEPGVLLCSEEFLADSEAFLPALKRTFETGLRRPPPTQGPGR
jgi:hypothetical protein